AVAAVRDELVQHEGPDHIPERRERLVPRRVPREAAMGEAQPRVPAGGRLEVELEPRRERLHVVLGAEGRERPLGREAAVRDELEDRDAEGPVLAALGIGVGLEYDLVAPADAR